VRVSGKGVGRRGRRRKTKLEKKEKKKAHPEEGPFSKSWANRKGVSKKGPNKSTRAQCMRSFKKDCKKKKDRESRNKAIAR